MRRAADTPCARRLLDERLGELPARLGVGDHHLALCVVLVPLFAVGSERTVSVQKRSGLCGDVPWRCDGM